MVANGRHVALTRHTLRASVSGDDDFGTGSGSVVKRIYPLQLLEQRVPLSLVERPVIRSPHIRIPVTAEAEDDELSSI